MDKQHTLEKTAANCLLSVIQNAWRFTKCFVRVLISQKKKKSKKTKSSPKKQSSSKCRLTWGSDSPIPRAPHPLHRWDTKPSEQHSSDRRNSMLSLLSKIPNCFTVTSVIYSLSQDFVFTTQCYTLTERISMKWK